MKALDRDEILGIKPLSQTHRTVYANTRLIKSLRKVHPQLRPTPHQYHGNKCYHRAQNSSKLSRPQIFVVRDPARASCKVSGGHWSPSHEIIHVKISLVDAM
jgi:hypothetical protein